MLTKFILLAIIIASSKAQRGHYAGSPHPVPDTAYRFRPTSTGSSSVNTNPNIASPSGNPNINPVVGNSNPNLNSRFSENFGQGQSDNRYYSNNMESWLEDNGPSEYVNQRPINTQYGFEGRDFPYEDNQDIRGGNSPISFGDSRSFQVLRGGQRKNYIYNPELDAWYPL
ncbi:uncharacterized protein LOC114335622 [Diabrotica virgifera virgifera]|uniref:Uncharacterized protein LOC114335622 n=1 Tax=Diabrotica virgifera virgifera TaxID=50390 RepID=A0A6P7GB96_DIAVI|nr:uncharacterized protein LOC114335622 [Diabrotica virgifera virgifera]